jgi:hypothetical protein
MKLLNLFSGEAHKADIAKLQTDLKWSEYRNQNYRNAIEKLTGQVFVFGYDPSDNSMVAGNAKTHGWFLVDPKHVHLVDEAEDIIAFGGYDQYLASLSN